MNEKQKTTFKLPIEFDQFTTAKEATQKIKVALGTDWESDIASMARETVTVQTMPRVSQEIESATKDKYFT